MKKKSLFFVIFFISSFITQAQVTQINSNKSLQVVIPLNTTKTILVSEIDSTLWITDGTLAGTIQITTTIKYEAIAGLLSGKVIFRGSTAATGSEIYSTDGTAVGTTLVKDIKAGASGSTPGEFALLNGFIYFDAATVAEGRELWRTDGSNAGTTIVKDIVAGTDSSNTINQYHLFSTGTYLLFAARTAATGVELWKSDGTNAGTSLLLDINTGNAGADSSNPVNFYMFNSIVLFSATDATHGNEIWKTDGTALGTVLVKDINSGTGSSTSFQLFPGFSFPVLLGFHTFNNRVYFNASDGTSSGEVWGTDGTTVNTTLLKNIVPGLSLSFILLIDAVNLPNKFIFPVSDGASRTELWESDGTAGGTVLFKSFDAINSGDIPAIFIPYSINLLNGVFSQALFQGNKFFFTASTTAAGYELWISDGTVGGTSMVKDIRTGTGDGIDPATNLSYLYTSNEIYFAATDATHGNELWKSDGTNAGTSMVADIYTNAGDALPQLFLVNNGKIIFGATNGDVVSVTDLYVVDGTFSPLPVKLTDFKVTAVTDDALLRWTTSQEINSKDFTIERSDDALHFEDIGTMPAVGNTATSHSYAFTDKDILSSGKTVVYYRLLTTDNDGKQAFSNTISLKIKAQQWSVRLLTNPVRDYVNVKVSGVTSAVHVAIKDLTGKTVYSNQLQRINTVTTIPASSLPHGIYVLVITNGNEKKSITFIK